TNKAAAEMRERLIKTLGEGRALPLVTTFHAFGQRSLHDDAVATKTELINETTRTQLIRDLPRPAAFKGTSVRELSPIISRAKTALHPPADEPTAKLVAAYNQALAEQNLHDFDDLLIRAYEHVRSAKIQLYRYVLVDEFQDTSELQYELLRLLAGRG